MFPPKVLHSNGGSQKPKQTSKRKYVRKVLERVMYFGSCAVTILKKVVGRATLHGDI